MKIGGVEGTHEEITDYLINNGMNPGEYFLSASAIAKPIHWAWVLVPVLGSLITCVIMNFVHDVDKKLLNLAFIFNIVFSIWAATAVQVKFKHAWASAIVGIGCLLLMMVAIEMISPSDILDYLKSIKSEKKNT